jgi:hypothetical protein
LLRKSRSSNKPHQQTNNNNNNKSQQLHHRRMNYQMLLPRRSHRLQQEGRAADAVHHDKFTTGTGQQQKGKSSPPPRSSSSTSRRRTLVFSFLQWFLVANGVFQISVLTAGNRNRKNISNTQETRQQQQQQQQQQPPTVASQQQQQQQQEYYQPNNAAAAADVVAAPAEVATAVRKRALAFNGIDQDRGDEQQAAIPCRYDGHCPVGRTCAVATSTTSDDKNPEYQRLPGTCLEIPIRKEIKPTQVCLDACRRELEMDEHFFHEKWPEILGQDATVSTSGRPGGCVLYYKRTSDRLTTTSIPEWEALRFRHVVRVDPAQQPNDDAGDDTWMVYCTEPCQSDNDCQPTSPTMLASVAIAEEKPFVCQQGACQRSAGFWEAMTVQQKQQQHDQQGGEMVIVTGATLSYFPGLQNLLGSIRYWAPHVKVVVYNLGDLGDVHKNWIRQQPNLLSFEWPNGIPDSYPPHMVRIKEKRISLIWIGVDDAAHVNTKNLAIAHLHLFGTCLAFFLLESKQHEGKVYAWKPIIVQETLAKYKMIFWLDAGNTLKGPITPIEDIVKRNGIVLFHGQDESMTPKAHHKSYEWFNFTKATMVTGPHISGNTQAWLSPSRYVESLVNCNAKCAMDPNCIAPEGSGLGNHRYDQTTLSLCAYHPKVWPNHHTEYLAASSQQVPKNAREPAYRMVYTARQAEIAYTFIEGNYLLDQQQQQQQQQQQHAQQSQRQQQVQQEELMSAAFTGK